jgi:hypothetical protein
VSVLKLLKTREAESFDSVHKNDQDAFGFRLPR